MGLQKESTSSSKAASADGSGTSSLSGPDSSRNGGYDDDLVTEHGNADAGEEDGEDPKPTFAEYWRVLSRNEYFRLFFISYCIDNVGNWLNFIACLSIMDQFGKSYYTAVYLSLRLLPPLLLAGVAGPLADRLNKRNWMMICAAGSGLSVSLLLLPFPRSIAPYVVWVSAILQFTFDALYSPLRQSMIPLIVRRQDLQIVTTLDSLAWSTIGAFGASLGGFICSTFGIRFSFAIDVATFAVLTVLIYRIPANYENFRFNSDGSAFIDPSSKSIEMSDYSNLPTDAADSAAEPEEAADPASSTSNESSSKVEAVDTSVAAAFRYMRTEPKVVAFCLLKACGALVWVSADLLQVRYSRMDSMHTLGDANVTLGILYSVVGIGCQTGPLVWNKCTRNVDRELYSRCLVSFFNFFTGYFAMLFATNIFIVIVGVFLRTLGSSTLWTYSTLMIQVSVPSKLQGRMFAFEKAIYTLFSITGVNICSALFDDLHYNEHQTISVVVVVSLAMLFLQIGIYSSVFGLSSSLPSGGPRGNTADASILDTLRSLFSGQSSSGSGKIISIGSSNKPIYSELSSVDREG